MLSEKILKFKNHIYIRMKSEDRVYSAYNLRNEYNALYGFDYSKEEIFVFFTEDNRFLSINDNQILLKEIIDKKISEDLLYKDVDYIKEFIKQKYFISIVHENVISDIINKYRKDNKIVLKYNLQQYEVRNKDDFDNAIIKEGKISYKALEQVSSFLEIGITELVMELSTKNVFMDDYIEMEYKCYKDSFEEVSSTEDHSYRVESYKNEIGSGLSIVSDINLDKEDSQNNILKLDLYPNELIGCLVALTYLELAGINNSNYINPQHLRSLNKLGILTLNRSSYKVSLIGVELINNLQLFFNSYRNYNFSSIIGKYYSTKELCSCMEIKMLEKDDLVWKTISDALKKIYLGNYYSSTFIDLIKLANNNNGSSVRDIFESGLNHSKHKHLFDVLVSDKASSGIKPIMQSKDVCFECNGKSCRLNGDSKMRCEKLLSYRYEHVDNFIKILKQDYKNIEKINQDPLLLKFLIPYTLCVANKKIMMKLNIVKKTEVLYKNAGLYCPAKDEWVVNNDLLV